MVGVVMGWLCPTAEERTALRRQAESDREHVQRIKHSLSNGPRPPCADNPCEQCRRDSRWF
jgi:hypothetical protein